MSIFNSLGSNYNFGFVLKALLAQNKKERKLELENFLSKKYGGEVLLTYKGREAIELALKSLNLNKDSCIAINGFTCFAVYEAIVKAGLNVDYIDIEKEDLNFSADGLKTKLKENPKIKVVIIQNTLGYPCEIEKIAKICKEKNITLIEDLALSVGTKYEGGSEAGTIGDFTILSFSQDKMIDAVSGGALIIKNNKYKHKLNKIEVKDEIKDRLYPLFTYLIRTTYFLGVGKIVHFLLKMFNLLSKPMDSNSQIKILPGWYCKLIKDGFDNLENNLNHRKKIASIYSENINRNILSYKLTKNILNSTNLRFPIIVKKRSFLIKFLKERNIFVSDIWYDAPISPKKYMSQTSYINQCPNSQKISEEILNLPTHINVSSEDALRISQLINKWLTQH